jgi:polyisoprenoid-binding protein YceI
MKYTPVFALVALVLVTGAGCMKKAPAPTPIPQPTPSPTDVREPVMPTPPTSANESGAMLFTIDTKLSTVGWFGERKVGNEHAGTVGIKAGEVVVKDGIPLRGTVTIDMSTLTATDSAAEMVNKHLKSDDFFAIEKYPTAMFTFKSAEKVEGNKFNVTGDLTIKGNTHSITFPATIVAGANGSYVGDASFSIDRTKWDIRYGSGKFFDSLGDKVIEDEIDFTVHIVTGASQELK